MRAKSSLFVISVTILSIGLAAGCSRGANDPQISSQVQSKIATDNNIQSKQIGVQSANGVVTLSGYVSSDMERSAAANDAAQVAGVKTVVNNLQVSQPTVAKDTTQAPPQPTTEAAAKPEATAERRPATPRKHARPAAPQRGPRGSEVTSSAAPAAVASAPAATTPSAPPPPPPVRKVTVPEGTTLSVRLIDPIDSERNHAGDTFRGTLSEPVYVGDELVIPSQADVEGQLVDAKSAGHFSGQSELALVLTRLTVNGKSYGLRTGQFTKTGTSRGKRSAATIGGGAALGAIIGGIAGGGKGAAIGTVAGAGAGTGVQAATKGQQIKLPSETVLTFRLESPLSVVPALTNDRNAGRNRVE